MDQPIASPKLVLAVVTGGILLGALGGQMANPVMKFAEEPDWRTRYQAHFSASPTQIADAGPEDLSPTWYGPVYGYPAVFERPFTPETEYVPERGGYSPNDNPATYDQPDQTVADAAATAAVLGTPSPAGPRSANPAPASPREISELPAETSASAPGSSPGPGQADQAGPETTS